jgi:hypothetical protein
LYVRLDLGRPAADLLADGYEFALTFLSPPGVRFSIRQADGRLAGVLRDRRGEDGAWQDRGRTGAAVAAGTIIEVALPLAELGLAPAAPLAFLVTVYDSDRNEIERHPTHRPVEVTVPDERFEARNWMA